ncbi:MAG TPA: sigma-70 family RNA polymerase sigma factor [Terriglobia bacterium]|nr:sigma-70 family RNA polymerase sigma factor [Terriglobia bacterium]
MTDPLEQASDLELAKLARETDEKAFAEIVRRYSPRVFQVASRFFRERSQVEDASQEIFLRAYTHLADYEGRGSLEGWLTRIATTTCLNLLRASQRRPESELAEIPEAEAEWLDIHLAAVSAERHRSAEKSREAADLADRVLGTLSPDDRLVLLMVDAEETPIKDVANATGWSESKVKVQALRARRRMREAVEKLLTVRKQDPSKKSTTEVEG